MKRLTIKRMIAFMIAGFATAAAFNAAAGAASHSQHLTDMRRQLPTFLHYHPTDGNPMRP